MPNRYFVCTPTRAPVEFDIADEHPVDEAKIAYFIRGFQLLEREYGLDGYTVCFTWSSLIPLPRIGSDVIAVIYGDEHCRVPPYVNQVAAVIKCHGLFPNFVPRGRPLRLAQIEIAEFLRNLTLWLPTGWRWAVSRRARARCTLVPVGYGLPSDAEPVPFAERPYPVSFLGSIGGDEGRSRLRAAVGTPKTYCRKAMTRALRGLQKRYGAECVPLGITAGFQDSQRDAGRTYFRALTRTKLCVAPRGTAHETLRISEGLRAGCVVIADRLPSHPFYRESPIIQITDWRELPSLAEELLADTGRLQTLHERGMRYWQDVLSEAALAESCAGPLGLRYAGA